MPRFVLLEHDHPRPHWDLMLEAGSVLWTWRLPQVPSPPCTLPVERLPDHRLLYLDYEGPVSGARGTVRRVLSGTFEWRESSSPDAPSCELVVELRTADWTARLRISEPESPTATAKFR
jgi:hypothetical protein